VLRFDKAGNLLTQLFKLTLNSNKPKDIQLKVDSEGSRLSKFDTKKLIMFIELEIIINSKSFAISWIEGIPKDIILPLKL